MPADVRLSSAIELVDHQREMLEAQIEADEAPRGSLGKLAKLDQKAAELRRRLELAAGMELGLWEDLWRTPQAVAWEQSRWTREVALYVRWQVHAELGDLDAGKEARQWSDRLGLNPTALLRNRWKIDSAPQPAAPTRTRSKSARDRLKVVPGGAAGNDGGSPRVG